MGVIYRLLFPSGKSYVGQTIKNPAARWRAHKTNSRFEYGSCKAVNAAIRKYGWVNVRKSVLARLLRRLLERTVARPSARP